jgi:hypothetical protein
MPAEWRLSLVLMLATGTVLAEEVSSVADEPPSMELLEFLGGFETPEGEWFDPLLLVEERQDRQPEVVGEDD